MSEPDWETLSRSAFEKQERENRIRVNKTWPAIAVKGDPCKRDKEGKYKDRTILFRWLLWRRAWKSGWKEGKRDAGS